MSDIVFYPDDRPGFTREKRGRGFSYRAPDGTRVACNDMRARLAAVAVPPAYDGVWITPKENGHLRASGRDERNRKQYIYHPDWTRLRDAEKYDRLADFGAALPRLRGWIARGLTGEIGSRDTAVAAALALIDRLSMRVGNPAYARENGSFAATTLMPRHLVRDGDSLRLAWRAKGGRIVDKPVVGARLCGVLTDMAAARERRLLTWQNGGRVAPVRAVEINSLVEEIAGNGFTAKTLRTWNGTHAAFLAAAKSEMPATIATLTHAASERLHNTPAIARSSYIHPAVLDSRDDLAGQPLSKARRGLRRGEAELVAHLESAPALAGDLRLVE